MQDMAKGIDPNLEKRIKSANSITLDEVVHDYIKDRTLKDSSIKDINKHLNGTFKAWKDQSIITINRDMV